MNIAIITARGGSKRIPRKNIREFHGKPIIAYSILTALKSKLFGKEVYVSTEDAEIGAIARQFGAQWLLRSPEAATDEATTADAMKDACERLNLENQRVCCIYPTAPMMSATDLERGSRAIDEPLATYAVSVGVEPLHDAGQFYWARAWAWRQQWPIYSTGTRLIPVASLRVCDINNDEDWAWALGQYEHLRKKGLV